MAQQLWRSARAGDWSAAYATYDAALASLQVSCIPLFNLKLFTQPPAVLFHPTQKDGLVELDEWMQQTLPQTLRAREPSPFVTQAELAKLMRWKLTKGKWCVEIAVSRVSSCR